MNEPISEMDKQLRDTPRVSLVTAIEMNKGTRPFCAKWPFLRSSLARQRPHRPEGHSPLDSTLAPAYFGGVVDNAHESW